MPRNIVFVAPFPLETTMRFVRAVAKLDDVRLLGVVNQPPEGDDAALYHDLVRVTDPLSVSDVLEGVEVLMRRHGQPYRLLSILEALQVQVAQARAHFKIPGTAPRTADLFRDKSRMKIALQEAGLPVARHKLLTSTADGEAFAREAGFPMVLKPPAGMGAKATFRVNDGASLRRSLEGMGVSTQRPVLAEEFLQGQEYSFETVTLGGTPRMHSVSRYFPSCLEVLENPWIQWACMLPRDISGPEFDGARAMGFGAIKALGLDTGVTHMEWFRRPDGSLAIGEIAQRPPGANITRMTGLAHDMDMYRAWARAVVDQEFDGPWDRKYAVGCAFLRGMGHGRVASVLRVREAHEAVGRWVVEAKLPTVGAPKSDSYEGDGYIIVRDPETEVVKKLLLTIVETVRVHYV
jgi:phosphoribosylaminoimidazole carboxylase (NCAIR synthetase)